MYHYIVWWTFPEEWNVCFDFCSVSNVCRKERQKAYFYTDNRKLLSLLGKYGRLILSFFFLCNFKVLPDKPMQYTTWFWHPGFMPLTVYKSCKEVIYLDQYGSDIFSMLITHVWTDTAVIQFHLFKTTEWMALYSTNVGKNSYYSKLNKSGNYKVTGTSGWSPRDEEADILQGSLFRLKAYWKSTT